jgi:hypothetical protein
MSRREAKHPFACENEVFVANLVVDKAQNERRVLGCVKTRRQCALQRGFAIQEASAAAINIESVLCIPISLLDIFFVMNPSIHS